MKLKTSILCITMAVAQLEVSVNTLQQNEMNLEFVNPISPGRFNTFSTWGGGG